MQISCQISKIGNYIKNLSLISNINSSVIFFSATYLGLLWHISTKNEPKVVTKLQDEMRMIVFISSYIVLKVKYSGKLGFLKDRKWASQVAQW